MIEPTYVFARGERGLFVEVYFPKKVVFQGKIFDALKDGHSEEYVKTYLRLNARALLTELSLYPHLFDPRQYETPSTERVRVFTPSVTEAKKRFDMYISQFQGWSLYEVDGMFFKRGRVYEERTQIVRLMFRMRSKYSAIAGRWDSRDVFRSVLFFVIRARGLIVGETVWDEAHKRQFMESHKWTNPAKKRFADRHYTSIAREAIKWIDDCALFIFGYLVREFSQKVLETKRLEEEIWVTTLVGITLNVIHKTKHRTTLLEREET